jgi:hypothetical protein
LVLALALGTGAFAAARAIVRAITGSRSIPTTTLPAATPFTLDGPIEQIGPDGWVVNGIAITLDAQTTVDGTPVVGAIVHVNGDVQRDATLLAQHITIAPAQLPPTSAPLPTSPLSAPTTLPVPAPNPVPPPHSEPGDSDESGKPDKPKPDKPKPDKPKPDKPKPDKPKPDKPNKPGKG